MLSMPEHHPTSGPDVYEVLYSMRQKHGAGIGPKVTDKFLLKDLLLLGAAGPPRRLCCYK